MGARETPKLKFQSASHTVVGQIYKENVKKCENRKRLKEKFFRPEIMDKNLTLNPKNTFGVRMP